MLQKFILVNVVMFLLSVGVAYSAPPDSLKAGYPDTSSGSSSETNFTASTPFFSAVNNQGVAVGYVQVELTTANDTSYLTPIWISGDIALDSLSDGTITSVANGNALPDIFFGMGVNPSIILQEGRNYIWRIRTADGSTYSDWSSDATIEMANLGTEILSRFYENKDTYYGTYYDTNGMPNAKYIISGGWGDWYYSYLEWDLSLAPLADDIITSNMYILCSVEYPNNPALYARRVTSSWTESDLSKTNHPTDTTIGQISIPQPRYLEDTIVDITFFTIGWLDESYDNFGIKLHPTYVTQSQHYFYSEDQDGINSDPFIEIKYSRFLGNNAPVLDEINNYVIQIGELLEFSLSASDVNNNDLVYSANNLPLGAILDSTTGLFSWTPGYDDSNSYNIEFIVTDNGIPAMLDSQVVSIQVNSVNNTAIIFSDDFNDNTLDMNKWSVMPVGVSEEEGILKTQMLVTNTGGGLNSNYFAVNNQNVIEINRKVKLHYANQYFRGAFYLLFKDFSGEGITFHYSTYGYTTGEYCAYQGFFIAKEIVDPGYCNQQINLSERVIPIWDTWFDERIVYNPQTGMVSWYLNDIWQTDFTVGTMPTGVAEARIAISSYGWSTGHEHFVDDLVITQEPVLGNTAPVLSPVGNQIGQEGQELQIQLSATDADGDNLVFSANNMPIGASLNPVSGLFSWTPDYSQSGNYVDIEFTVTDDRDPIELDVELVTITIGDNNRAPEITAISPISISEGELIDLAISVQDPDGDNYSLILESAPMGMTLNDINDSIVWTPSYLQEGTYVVYLIATDDGSPNESDSIGITITVGNVVNPTKLTDYLLDDIIIADLSKVITNSYFANLKKVNIFIEKGKITPAINQLLAFIAKVNADRPLDCQYPIIDGITCDQADYFVTLAEEILSELGSN